MDVIDVMTMSDPLIAFSDTESLLATSQYAQVIFRNVLERYNHKEDLQCSYMMQNEAQPGDRILLLKLGWQSLTDYVMMEWAPTECKSSDTYTITFSSQYLPTDCSEFYQFCYITMDNAICGASIPFQFFSGSEPPPALQKSMDDIIVVEMGETEATSEESCDHCGTLRQDNEKIMKTLDVYKKQMNDLQKQIDELSKSLLSTQQDVSEFKIRLHLAGEEYKKLYIDKMQTERKYQKLLKKCHAKKNSKASCTEFDLLEELEPFPPFPLALPNN